MNTPSSYLKAISEKETRKLKIKKAKERIARSLQLTALMDGIPNASNNNNNNKDIAKKPVMTNTNNVSTVTAEQHAVESATIDSVRINNNRNINGEELDAEDYEIEKCLLAGAKEEDLEAGYFHLSKKIKPGLPDNMDTLSDISDSEVTGLLRTKKEVEFLSALSDFR